MESLIGCVAGYLTTPRIFFSHLISVGIFYSLSKQSNDIGQFARTVVRYEIVQLLLWLVVPVEGLAVALSLLFCLQLYDSAVSTSVAIYQTTTVAAETDLSRWLKSGASGPENVSVTSDCSGRMCVDAPLRCIRCYRGRQSRDSGDDKSAFVINLDDVRSVTPGCPKDMLGRVRRLDIEIDMCLTVVCGQGRNTEMLILAADSPESFHQWLKLLQHMSGTVDDIGKEWLKKLVSVEWLTEVTSGKEKDSDGKNFTVDEAYSVLQKANRNADRNYVAEIFKTLSKANKSSKSRSLNLDEFVSLFMQMAVTAGVQHIYTRLKRAHDMRASMTAKMFLTFLSSQQKERSSMEDVLQWIVQHEPVLSYGNLSVAGFSNYIIAEENSIFNREHRVIYQDMLQPLSHYFIATSHNTYLTKDQLKSKSSVDAYINAFKRGCKCVELDCWDGPNSEPIIYHGHTLTSKILFKDVIQSIKDHAFCVSKYPVILSFENHCSVEQQKVMAMHLKNILGDMLHTGEIPEDPVHMPSPEDLSGYVLVKAKKRRGDLDDFDDVDDDFSDEEITEEEVQSVMKKPKSLDDIADTISMRSEVDDEETGSISSQQDKKVFKLKNLMQTMEAFHRRGKNDKPKVPKVAQELSDLVTYCQATSFKSFENSRQNCKHYEMSSFGEKKALKFAKDDARMFLQYNQRQLSRIYPAGGRIDSSNYDPMILWTVGSQLVALNYQTACREMQLNQGLFQDNGGCGYILKPEFMRCENIEFDPHAPLTAVHTLQIRDLSGHQIPYKTNKTIKSERSLLVQVRVTGIEADNHVVRTKTVKNNGYNPRWEDELTLKIHVPELAVINFTVYTKDAFVAQYSLPFRNILQGYRRVPLQTKHCEPLPTAYLLAHISVQTPI